MPNQTNLTIGDRPRSIGGPGSRTPAIIISPFANKGFVDKTSYETVSILSFIEKRWSLPPLTDRDRNASPLTNAFDFTLSAN